MKSYVLSALYYYFYIWSLMDLFKCVVEQKLKKIEFTKELRFF